MGYGGEILRVEVVGVFICLAVRLNLFCLNWFVCTLVIMLSSMVLVFLRLSLYLAACFHRCRAALHRCLSAYCIPLPLPITRHYHRLYSQYIVTQLVGVPANV